MNGSAPVFYDYATVLLLRTMGAAATLGVALILLRALYFLRRSGETPKGFVPIATLLLFGGVTRFIRLLYFWLLLKPSYWLDVATSALLFVTLISIPLILSPYYLPVEEVERSKRYRQEWLRWGLIGNAVCGLAAFGIALSERSRLLPSVTISVLSSVSGLLLWLQTSMFKNLQLRRRGLLLFAGLTTAGLFGLSAIVFGAVWLYSLDSATVTAGVELCNMLIVLGVMFVFVSVRLADVIVKQVIRLYVWFVVSVLLWATLREIDVGVTGTTTQAAGFALISVALVGATLMFTPVVLEKLDRWIHDWVFEVPDFDATIQAFWEQIAEFENGDEVYRAGEETIRDTLSLAAARITRLTGLRSSGILKPIVGPNPRFLPLDSPLRSIISPPADVLLPLFQEGTPEYWMMLSNGAIRPPLTATELSFVTRIAGAIQGRIGALLGEQRRLERLRREGAFREEIADAELRALRAQINPHFLFNSLNTIADLSAAAPEKAEEMTLRLAAVFRYVLANTDRPFTSVNEEINFAKSYLGIEEARFGDRLRVRFDVDQSVLQEKVPALLLQPLIENALKHGLGPKRQGGTLRIGAKRTALGFTLTVADDGVGLPEAQQDSQDNGTHVGLLNVKKRLRTAYEDRASFSLRARAGGGTQATVVINTDKGESA